MTLLKSKVKAMKNEMFHFYAPPST